MTSLCSETWAPHVTKLAAFDQMSKPLGAIYLDLYRRARKYSGCAQFTIMCGKQLGNGTYRHPMVVLCCSLPGPHASLSYDEVCRWWLACLVVARAWKQDASCRCCKALSLHGTAKMLPPVPREVQSSHLHY